MHEKVKSCEYKPKEPNFVLISLMQDLKIMHFVKLIQKCGYPLLSDINQQII